MNKPLGNYCRTMVVLLFFAPTINFLNRHMAGSAYLLAWLVMHLLAPNMQPVTLGQSEPVL